MSIATAITNAQNKVAAAYTAVSNKGGTLPATQNLSNLPTAISSISGGGGTDNLPAFVSEGVSTFTDNTITKIRPYAFYNDNSAFSTSPITSVSCQNVTEVGADSFQACSQLTSVSFPSLITIGGSAFSNCTGLTALPLPGTVTTIGNNAFSSCSSVTSFTIPSNVSSIGSNAFYTMENVEEVNYNATNAVFTTSTNKNGVFSYLGKNKNNLVFNIGSNVRSIPAYFLYPASTVSYKPNIATLNIPNNNSIESIGKHAFWRCTGLSSLTLPSMTVVNTSSAMQYAFQYCTNLTSLSFPALTSTSFGSYTNQFNNMLDNVTGCTVHFPSNLQSVIGGWTDVTAGFGGTNTTVLFDLTATT